MTDGAQTILVVEDDRFVRALVTTILSEHHYQVLSVGDGEAALQILRGEVAVDLLFTDLVLPGTLTGPRLAAEARRLRPNLKVLFTSGYSDASIEEIGLVESEAEFVAKPCRRHDLPARIKASLERP